MINHGSQLSSSDEEGAGAANADRVVERALCIGEFGDEDEDEKEGSYILQVSDYDVHIPDA